MRYHRLTREERYQIWALFRSGFGPRQIGRTLGRTPSTISRELRRNASPTGYRAFSADRLAKQRRSQVHRPYIISGQLKTKIVGLLRLQWSPEQISGRLKLRQGISISPETIYQFVYRDFKLGGKIYSELRRGRKRRRSQSAGRAFKRCGRRLSYPSINLRPSIVEQRKRLGDYERDSILGVHMHRGPALLSIVERKSRRTYIRKVAKIKAELAHKATVSILRRKRVHTLTNDNGPEFADYQKTEKALNTSVYFNDPYSSWQRGTNENTNGLIRQYFPKGTDFSKVTERQIRQVQARLNNRPRKTLGYLTPLEVENSQKSGVALRV